MSVLFDSRDLLTCDEDEGLSFEFADVNRFEHIIGFGLASTKSLSKSLSSFKVVFSLVRISRVAARVHSSR